MPPVSQESDEQLWLLARQGDSTAFARWVDRYADQVYAIAYARLRDREQAEDLVQEVFLRAWLHMGSIRDIHQPHHWLCRVTRNLAISRIRQNQRTSRLIQMLPMDSTRQDQLSDLPDPRNSPGVQDQEAQQAEDLARALERMPDSDREIIALHFMGGASHQQIAELLGTHRTTVTRRLDKCLENLRVQMSPMAPSPQAEPPLKPFGQGMSPQARTALFSVLAVAATLPAQTRAAIQAASSDTLQLAPWTSVPAAPTLMAQGALIMSLATKVVTGVAALGILAAGYYAYDRSTADPAKALRAIRPDVEKPYEIGQEVTLEIPIGKRHRLTPSAQPPVKPEFASYIPDYSLVDFVALPGGRLKMETIHRTTGQYVSQEVGPTPLNPGADQVVAEYQIWEETNRAYIHSVFVRQTTEGLSVNLYTVNKPQVLPEIKALEKKYEQGAISRTQQRDGILAVLERESMLPQDPDNRAMIRKLLYSR